MKSVVTLGVLWLVTHGILTAHDAGGEMARAAKDFIASLSPEQAKRAVFAFDAPMKGEWPAGVPGTAPPDERRNWHYVPRARNGVAIKEMNYEQRLTAQALLATGLSHSGHAKAAGVMSLEAVLAALENNPVKRDPEQYFVSIFGTPGKAPWSWRVEGHHLSLNFTISTDGAAPAMTPSFFGSNPAEVRQGPRKGLRVLAEEEDAGRELVKSLDENQRKKAVILAEAPADILNVPGRQDTKAEGIPWADLRNEQRPLLMELVRLYIARHRTDLASRELARVTASAETLHFAWAGGIEPGQPHYYRVQGNGFVLEYDNTQNNANHVHALWRDFDRDFGTDALRDHYRKEHAGDVER